MRTPSAPSSVRSAAGRPWAATAAGALGLLGAAGTGLIAAFAILLGGWSADDGTVEWWLYPLLALAGLQAWGAVRLLRRRGWLLLALACLPGLLLAGALVSLHLEYDSALTLLDVLGVLPLAALVLAVTPEVRRWAASGSEAAG